MKLRDLKKKLDSILERFPNAEEWFVVMSKDAEGNRFSLLTGIDDVEYVEYENPYDGEIYVEDDYEPNAICLWPM